jgi:glutathione S-transferase
MTWTLISATPSPYARKVRIALAEKGIPFELKTELDDGTAVYESHYILDWLETKYPSPPMLPQDVDERLFAKKVEVVADGMCDAMVLAFFEKQRDQDKQSKPWTARYGLAIDTLSFWMVTAS